MLSRRGYIIYGGGGRKICTSSHESLVQDHVDHLGYRRRPSHQGNTEGRNEAKCVCIRFDHTGLSRMAPYTIGIRCYRAIQQGGQYPRHKSKCAVPSLEQHRRSLLENRGM